MLIREEYKDGASKENEKEQISEVGKELEK